MAGAVQGSAEQLSHGAAELDAESGPDTNLSLTSLVERRWLQQQIIEVTYPPNWCRRDSACLADQSTFPLHRSRLAVPECLVIVAGRYCYTIIELSLSLAPTNNLCARRRNRGWRVQCRVLRQEGTGVQS
jgi:hypothetical protein